MFMWVIIIIICSALLILGVGMDSYKKGLYTACYNTNMYYDVNAKKCIYLDDIPKNNINFTGFK